MEWRYVPLDFERAAMARRTEERGARLSVAARAIQNAHPFPKNLGAARVGVALGQAGEHPADVVPITAERVPSKRGAT